MRPISIFLRDFGFESITIDSASYLLLAENEPILFKETAPNIFQDMGCEILERKMPGFSSSPEMIPQKIVKQ